LHKHVWFDPRKAPRIIHGLPGIRWVGNRSLHVRHGFVVRVVTVGLRGYKRQFELVPLRCDRQDFGFG